MFKHYLFSKCIAQNLQKSVFTALEYPAAARRVMEKK